MTTTEAVYAAAARVKAASESYAAAIEKEKELRDAYRAARIVAEEAGLAFDLANLAAEEARTQPQPSALEYFRNSAETRRQILASLKPKEAA